LPGAQFHVPQRRIVPRNQEDRMHSRQWEGKQKVDPEEENDGDLGFHKAKKDLKAVYGHSDSESSDNKHRKMLYVMFGGSWDTTSWRVVKTLR
jgi:hypothetical protein